ncbi:MAG: hypothetical protein NT178_17030 [Proteobacteria bacterium]|nr:hypothetical protein [Pseudomonadota bacterium]
MSVTLLSTSFLLIIIFWSLMLRLFTFSHDGSDKYVHGLIIDLIKLNKHRFISKIEPFLYGSRMGYPQLVHWVLSFFNDEKIEQIGGYLPVVCNVMIGIMHLFFVNLFLSQADPDLQPEYLIAISGLLFISSGLFFNFNNARNQGLSARGVAIVLVSVYIYSSINYITTSSLISASICVCITVLIFLSNLFAVQFILFTSIPVAILSGSFAFILFPIIGFAIFFFLFRETALNWLKWQWGHKRWYYKYGAKYFLLSGRESIWRDFIFDVWKMAISNWKRATVYLFYNPAVEVVWGVPILVPLLFYFVCLSNGKKHTMNDSQNILLIFIYSALIVFIITSFQKTRFLGEPERYIDFIISPISIIGTLIFKNNLKIIIICIIIGFARIALIAALGSTNSRRAEDDPLTVLRKKIDTIGGSSIRLLSNNMEVTKRLLTPNIKVYFGWAIQTEFGKHHFTDIYDYYPIIKESMIVPLIREYGINMVIIDLAHLTSDMDNLFRSIKISIVFQNDRYKMVQVIEGQKR